MSQVGLHFCCAFSLLNNGLNEPLKWEEMLTRETTCIREQRDAQQEEDRNVCDRMMAGKQKDNETDRLAMADKQTKGKILRLIESFTDPGTYLAE